MASLDSDILAETLASKCTLLLQLRELGKRQLDFIRENEMTGLLKLLAAKQHLLAGMQTLQRRLDPFRNQDPLSRQWRSEADRQTCARTMAQCEALLAEIMQQEKHSESILVERRNATARQLETVHHAAHARVAYATSSGLSGAAQLDLTSGH